MSKETQQIIEKLNSLAPNEKAVLATVVDVRGSSYRLPGAKMLILKNGDTFGTVSGGCLEADVLERSKKVLQTGEASIFTYDTTIDENSVFSLNMGCRGVIRILLESIKKDDILFRAFQIASEHRYSHLTATLISSDTDLPVGARIFYDEVTFATPSTRLISFPIYFIVSLSFSQFYNILDFKNLFFVTLCHAVNHCLPDLIERRSVFV